MTALDLLQLDDATGTLRGTCVDGAIGRLFGGHVLAQSIVAASRASDGTRALHSVHSHFLAPGRRPAVEYSVELVKGGTAIDVIRADAWQSARRILTTMASFQAEEPSAEFQASMPDVAQPEHLAPTDYRPPGTSAAVRAPFELRYLDDRFQEDDLPDGDARLGVWIRTRDSLADAPQLHHAALLAYATDFLITRAAHLPLRGGRVSRVGSSLDNAIWFHRPFRIDEWVLVMASGLTFAGSRSLCLAEMYDLEGRRVASSTQEALLRSDPSPD